VTPDISEFSYGFALTQELISAADPPVRAAPILPSLIKEGRTAGGYDAHLDIPGFLSSSNSRDRTAWFDFVLRKLRRRATSEFRVIG
jgi:hypothetical protein